MASRGCKDEENSADAPRASAQTHRKQREGRHLQPDFRGRLTRQRHDARKTPRGSPFTPRISRTLHAPASRSAGTSERVATYVQNIKDAPRASAPTHRQQREGRHLRPEFRGRSTRHRHDAPQTARGSPLTSRISRTLHATASRRAENQREGRHLRPEFRRRSTRQRHDAPNQREGCHLRPEYKRRSTRQRSNAPKTTRRSPLTARISRTLHAPASRRAGRSERVATCVQNFEDAPRTSVTTHGKQREGRHLRPEFRGRSTRHRHDAPETERGSPLTPRISRTPHAPASRRAENNETVATYAQNFEDAPRASVTTRRKQREGRHKCPES